MADAPKRRLSPVALGVILAVFVLGVVVYVFANPGGPGGESGESRSEEPSGGTTTTTPPT